MVIISYGSPNETAWTVIDGQRYDATSDGCALHALCRVLRDAGIPDHPWEVPGRLKGSSIHWMADHYVADDDRGMRYRRWNAGAIGTRSAPGDVQAVVGADTPGGRPAALRDARETRSLPLFALSDRWRVAHDGQLQWIVEYRSGRWRPRRFHVERDALLRSITELCGPVDPAAVAAIQAWPARYAPARFNPPA